MNGLNGTRRSARPVRLSLARQLGAGIDGAWWPHTASVARELPELIGVLHRPLGEIVDIGINWSTAEAPLDLLSIVSDGKTLLGAQHRRPRLMVVEGRGACARLLVVPPLTSKALGAMVMRCAAALPSSLADRQTPSYDIATRVMRAAIAESAKWVERLQGQSGSEIVAAQDVQAVAAPRL